MPMFQTPGSLGATTGRHVDQGTRIRAASPVPGFKGKTGSPGKKPKPRAVQQAFPADVQMAHRESNQAAMNNPNVKAFMDAISKAEGGGYDFMFGALAGKPNDPWRMKSYDTHPGYGKGGQNSPAGMYQITKETWQDFGTNRQGISDFSPASQDLIALEMLRDLGVMDFIIAGDLPAALNKASGKWAALPQGPGKPGRYPKQPSKSYEEFVAFYKAAGGLLKAGLEVKK